MRISDWSSDVCSSDLRRDRGRRPFPPPRKAAGRGGAAACAQPLSVHRNAPPALWRRGDGRIARASGRKGQLTLLGRAWRKVFRRSEEHTSELQSLMRISYAVFCLKKKNKTL